MHAELTPRICVVDNAMESAAPLYRALDMGLDELYPAAHHQSRPPSVTLFNIVRPADDRHIVWVEGVCSIAYLFINIESERVREK